MIHFYSLFLRVRAALFHIPNSPSHSSRYTPFDLSGGKVLRKEKKKPKSRKRFCCPTSLASSLGSKQRRKAEKRAETQICAHLYTSLVPQTLYGELNAPFWVLLSLSCVWALCLFIVFATFRYTLARAIPWNLAAVWLQYGFNDSSPQKFLGSRCTFIKEWVMIVCGCFASHCVDFFGFIGRVWLPYARALSLSLSERHLIFWCRSVVKSPINCKQPIKNWSDSRWQSIELMYSVSSGHPGRALKRNYAQNQHFAHNMPPIKRPAVVTALLTEWIFMSFITLLISIVFFNK